MLPKLIHNYSQFSPTYTPPCSRQQIRRPHLQTSHLNAIMSDSSWNTNFTCSASSSFEQVDSTSVFPTINSRQAHESYPSPASSIPSPSRAAQQDTTIVSQEQTLPSTQDNQTNDCYSSSYVDSNVDHDNRILSGRLSRLEYRGQRRRDGMQSPYPRATSALSPVCIFLLLLLCLYLTPHFVSATILRRTILQRLDHNHQLALEMTSTT